MRHERIGDILVRQGAISASQLDYCLKVQRNNGGQRLGKVLMHYDFIDDLQMVKALADQVGWALYQGQGDVSLDGFKTLGKDFCLKHAVLPILVDGKLACVLSKAEDLAVVDHIKQLCGEDIVFYLGTEVQIRGALPESKKDSLSNKDMDMGLGGGGDLLPWFHRLLNRALARSATDIHIEASIKAVEIRVRIDGVLSILDALPLSQLPRLANIIFHKAGVAISDFNHFHDARFSYPYQDRMVDARVSHIPTIHGSSVVIRLLDQSRAALDLNALGFYEKHWGLIQEGLRMPYGLTLVVGPTGCGKTTTLYAILNHLKSIERKIITIEDPVEMHLSLMTQVQTHEKRAITFPNAVRAFLRHDPDIIFIGEIRDALTAQEAMRASMTGHQVFATLHANRPIDAFMRLQDLGVSNLFIAAHLRMVIAQRLLRKSAASGYKGRVLVSEVLTVDEKIEDCLYRGDMAGIKRIIREDSNYVSMAQHAKVLLKEEIVDETEIKRVLG